MRTTLTLTALVALATAVAATAAPSQTAVNAAESIKARQSHYKEIGAAFKGVRDELGKPKPDVAVIQKNAKVMEAYAPQINGWFPVGTGSGAGLKTAARAEIWSDPKGFSEQVQNFTAQTKRFNAAAQSGDLNEIKTAVATLGGACKSCHDRFKVKES